MAAGLAWSRTWTALFTGLSVLVFAAAPGRAQQAALGQAQAQLGAGTLGQQTQQAGINALLADGTLYARDNPRALQLATRNTAIDAELLDALERWELLGA